MTIVIAEPKLNSQILWLLYNHIILSLNMVMFYHGSNIGMMCLCVLAWECIAKYKKDVLYVFLMNAFYYFYIWMCAYEAGDSQEGGNSGGAPGLRQRTSI